MAARASIWTRVALRLPPDAADALGALCMELGAPGAITSQRDLRRTGARPEPPRTTSFEVYFPPGLERRRLRASLARAVKAVAREFPGVQRRTLCIEAFELPDYGARWRDHFPAVRIGRRLLIAPSWEHAPGDSRRVVLRIDPGQAFGTGHHPTTRGCLLALEEQIAPETHRGLDVGCGTGILALAMRRLGVATVVAVDNDPLAREATRVAAAANGIRGVRIAATLASARGHFDLVVANLYAGLLVELAPELAARLTPTGVLVVSGLLATQERPVRTALRTVGMKVTGRRCLSTWVTLIARPSSRRP